MSDADLTKENQAGTETQTIDLDEFSSLLEKDFRIGTDEQDKFHKLVANLAVAAQERTETQAVSGNAVKSIKAMIDGIDQLLSKQVNEILHNEDVKSLEGTWRGLHYLVYNTETDAKLKIRYFNISKDELAEHLVDYEGDQWDQSQIYKQLYENEYSSMGGEPFGAVIGAYEFSHRPKDVGLLRSMAGIAAAAHAPFIAAAAPQLFRMESWEELPNPHKLAPIFDSPDYASWNSFRQQEDSRYIGLTMPRVLARLPYGRDTIPVKGFAFEEEVAGDHEKYTWMNAAFAMGVNINRSHKLTGWGTQIRGVESGGTVMNLPVHSYATDDGSMGMKCPTEVSIDDRREKELADLGLMPLLHRKNTDQASFVGAHSLQDDEARAGALADDDAKANERLSAQLPYLFPVCRFAHYLKAIARDKVGTFKEKSDMQKFLSEWIGQYVLANPSMASDVQKAQRPLAKAEVVVDSVDGRPGYYSARFYLRPHYQLEGINTSLRLVSELPSAKGN